MAFDGSLQASINLRVQSLHQRLQKRRQFLSCTRRNARSLDRGCVIQSETSWLPLMSLNFDGRSGGLSCSSP
jgi:hypothetical protein